jgi:hypothetical protein
VNRDRRPTRALGLFLALACTGALACLGVPAPSRAEAADDVEAALVGWDPVEAGAVVADLALRSDTPSRKSLVKFALHARSARVRAAAAEALAAREDRDAAVDSLVFRWTNAGALEEVRLHAVEALGRLPSPRTERALLARRESESGPAGDAVPLALCAVGSSAAAVDAIADLLKGDASVARRAAAADALGRIGGEGALRALAAAAGSEGSRLVRERVVDALLAQGPEAARSAVLARWKRAGSAERTALRFAAARIAVPDLLDEWREALRAGRTVDVVGGCLALGGLDTPPTLAELDALVEKAKDGDALVRDAAVAALLRRTGGDAEVRVRLLGRRLPTPLRVALLASLEATASDRAREALASAAGSRELDVALTAIGALRRGHGTGGQRALEALAAQSQFVRATLDRLAKAGGTSQPRAFVALGRADRMEEATEPMGWVTTRLSSFSALARQEPSPEDVVLVDGPGETDREGEEVVRRFVLLGGTLVLGYGFENVLARALVPHAFDPAPPGLTLETAAAGGGTSVQDFAVTAASGAGGALGEALAPRPAVMLVQRPVVPRSAAARPLLWSAEMEDRYRGGAGCVAAEVRFGCGRVLLLGAMVGLRGSLQAESWFQRVRLERHEPLSRARKPEERRLVAFDAFGFPSGRLVALDGLRYSEGDAPWAAAADHPAARWLAAYLKKR